MGPERASRVVSIRGRIRVWVRVGLGPAAEVKGRIRVGMRSKLQEV